ncbi:MAG TPA: hypothetical protein VE155_00960 [Pseudonocardiaceae bacterium]|jgi:hypothetical protein|nr:hypothetical protein [Pseudonocardiaceae bacterium]
MRVSPPSLADRSGVAGFDTRAVRSARDNFLVELDGTRAMPGTVAP